MAKSLSIMCLRSFRVRRASAFTLAELVVAVAILALMMTLAGQVFSVTSKSTGQAMAITNVTQNLRVVEKTLREDLRHLDRQNSLLLIESNPIPMYWTKAGLDADGVDAAGIKSPVDGYPHPVDPEREVFPIPNNATDVPLEAPRLDMLMFFCSRKATSLRSPGTTAQAQQVVYGHAYLSDWVPVGDSFQMSPVAGNREIPADGSPLLSFPAEDMHLARRSVLLAEAPWEAPPVSSLSANEQLWADSLDDEDLLTGRKDVLADFRYEQQVMELHDFDDDANAPYLPRVLPLNNPVPARSLLDVAPPAGVGSALGHYFLPNCASFKVEWALDPDTEYVEVDENGVVQMDGNDPVNSRPKVRRLGELFWVDMGRFPVNGDPRTGAFKEIYDAADRARAAGDVDRAVGLERFFNATVGMEGGNSYTMLDRFQDVENWNLYGSQLRPNLAVFKPTTREIRDETASLSPDPVFPSALRITVDVFDDTRRLERPLRHVMVIPIGQ